MKKSKLDSQCYKIKNFFTKYPDLVHIPFYNWQLFARKQFKDLVIDCYNKLGGK